MSVMEELNRKLRVNRMGVLYYFSLEGCTIGLWTAFLPQIQDHLDLSDGSLGTAVFFFYLGQMVGTPAVAFCLRQFGSKSSTYAGSLLFEALLVCISFANGFSSLSGILLAFGIGECLLDVSMNSLAVLVERVADYPIIGSFHGSYSVAAAVGGVIGGSLMSAGFIQLHVYLVLFAMAFMISTFFGVAMYSHKEELYVEGQNADKEPAGEEASLITRRNRSDDRFSGGIGQGGNGEGGSRGGGSVSLKGVPQQDAVMMDNDEDDVHAGGRGTLSRDSLQQQARASSSSSGSMAITGSGSEKVGEVGGPRTIDDVLSMLMIPTTKDMIALAVLAFLAAFGEAAITTWTIIYTQREFDLQGDGSLTALTFSLFEVFMGIGRYFVDTLRSHLGTKRMVLYSGIFTIAGLTLMVASPNLSEEKDKASFAFVAACIGASCTGIGLSTLIPISYISAAYTEGHSGTSIAIVATWAGAGCLASPPTVGILSTSLASLRFAMASLIVAMAPLCVLAFFLPPDKYTAVQRTDSEAEGGDEHSILSSSSVTEDLSQPLIV